MCWSIYSLLSVPSTTTEGDLPWAFANRAPGPWGTSLPASLCLSHATAVAALTDQNTTTSTMTRKSQWLATAAAAEGLSLTATITTAATYRDTRSRPRTSSHMSGVNPIRMMVVVVVVPLLSPLLSSPLSSFSPVTAAATEAAHMSVCYPHGSHTLTHTHHQGAKRERESLREREGRGERVTVRE